MCGLVHVWVYEDERKLQGLEMKEGGWIERWFKRTQEQPWSILRMLWLGFLVSIQAHLERAICVSLGIRRLEI